MPIISSYTDPEPFSEDQTLLTLYMLAGEESGGFVTFNPDFFIQIGKALFFQGDVASPVQSIGAVDVRELTPSELISAERDLWIHYHQQKADRINDRLFAAFAGSKLIGVARCSRHPDGLEVDAVYVLDEYRRRGFARSVMVLLIEECGRQETLYMHSKIELVDFYGSLGFYPMAENDLPKTIRDRFGFCMGNLKGIDVCPMKRDPAALTTEQNT
ncbi:MAG: GNAT family N-acetyltransferase [Methanoregula sp.]|jgi:GNAT superfamily N-acetyltransferase|nr:GNAT family N-acetyltransferase [Methanoregula sp.]